ncbi:MAG: glycolate oxidase subunit GlcF [Geminicoccaceae bacterium]|nr:glycolate oxidase subunit GlcF [Geminicoccaceae bacterium]
MQTFFSEQQLENPVLREANTILRTCVHCGFCTATCPTYQVLGDELDSPRGRIYLMKQMLEEGSPATEGVVRHVDRCLSCLSCMTTCPSGVNYMHLVDHARAHIEATYERPAGERFLRAVLARVLPDPTLFRLSLMGAALVRPLRFLLRGSWRAMLELAPAGGPKPPSRVDLPATHAAHGERPVKRVVLMTGCAQQALAPEINEATVRLLTRHGVEVVIASGAGCCGSLTHHMGREEEALASARANIDAWLKVRDEGGLDAVVINASGCGTTVKDYGHMLRHDPVWAGRAAEISALARDIAEILGDIELRASLGDIDLVVACHSACSMQHGQKITELPKRLLREAGFTVKDVPEGHLCCGSAGTYNITQPEIAGRLRARKVANIERVQPDVIAAGNIGCMIQIGVGTDIPVVHTVELLDWATGGPVPPALEGRPA